MYFNLDIKACKLTVSRIVESIFFIQEVQLQIQTAIRPMTRNVVFRYQARKGLFKHGKLCQILRYRECLNS